jgi:ubiquinone/menaquinone biosynthesis C-methylase UbiE
VLDDGCGAGRHSLYMAGRGIRALGLDLSPVAIRQAREWAQREGAAARFAIADCAELPIADECVAAVVAWETLYYGTEQRVVQSLAEMLRVLQTGGRFLALLKSKQDSRFHSYERISEHTCMSEQGLPMTCFDRGEIQALLGEKTDEVGVEVLAHSLDNGGTMIWNFVVTGRKG